MKLDLHPMALNWIREENGWVDVHSGAQYSMAFVSILKRTAARVSY